MKIIVALLLVWWLVLPQAFADFPPARANRKPKPALEAEYVPPRSARKHCARHEWEYAPGDAMGQWDAYCKNCPFVLRNVTLSDTDKEKMKVGGN